MNPRTLAPKLLIATLVISTALVGGVGTAAADYTTPSGGGSDNPICWIMIYSPDGEFHPEHHHFHEASTVCRTYGD